MSSLASAGDAVYSSTFPTSDMGSPSTSPTPTHAPCTALKLSSGGLLDLGEKGIMTLSHDVIFQPACSGQPPPKPPPLDQVGTQTSIWEPLDPFYASTSPQIYAIATATIISYMLVIILFITPRTSFITGATGGGSLLGRGIISAASGGTSVIGVGSRPWLQKVATLTVAISLTIATADTFKVVREQYNAGYQDASGLTDRVAGSLEIRIIRVISDTCLWLAQVQTLIRLFTRHKEKVTIKWLGFGLIVLDTSFSILNYFVVAKGETRQRRFVDAIPALNYLFAIALSLLYAAWVIYYSLSKHRYAFFHRKMPNISVIAVLALVAVLIPIVFFVLDISQPDAAGWGSYVRWVGAAAASVVVWEWVERIEALERNEKKDGILGREIFDGDEMLEAKPSTVASSSIPRRKKDVKRRPRGGNQGSNKTGWSDMTSFAHRLVRVQLHKEESKLQGVKKRLTGHNRGEKNNASRDSLNVDQNPGPPLPVASPVSRADTTSADSTVYIVHYHGDAELGPVRQADLGLHPPVTLSNQSQTHALQPQAHTNLYTSTQRRVLHPGWQRVINAFRLGRLSPPPEVLQARAEATGVTDQDKQVGEKPKGMAKSMSVLGKIRHNKPPQVDLASLPRTIIPAPRRGIDMLIEASADVQANRNQQNRTPSGLMITHEESPMILAEERRPGAVMNLPDIIQHPASSHLAASSGHIPDNPSIDGVFHADGGFISEDRVEPSATIKPLPCAQSHEDQTGEGSTSVVTNIEPLTQADTIAPAARVSRSPNSPHAVDE